MKRTTLTFLAMIILALAGLAQATEKSLLPKVSHAEPIYVDLIRDLGARKGEKELNVGMGVASYSSTSQHSFLVEYEFAPLNRLGMEIEVPLAFNGQSAGNGESHTHGHNGLEGVKVATQYSFFVSEKYNTTLAAGYMYEARLNGATLLSRTGAMHNPFFIAAKKWGRQWHTLIYTGPCFDYNKTNGSTSTTVLLNTSVHYMLPGTKNFVGVELDEALDGHEVEIMVRPQLKMVLSSASALGLAVGIPGGHSDRNLDFLLRWVYELKRKK
jgi:hypothetical protein